MSETLPVPAGDQPVWMMALAKAAAELAAQEALRRKDAAPAEPVTRDDVEEIATACAETVVRRVLSDLLDVDLDSRDSRRALRDDLDHARKGRTWWNKALGILAVTAMSVLAAGLVAAFFKALPAVILAAGGGK